MSLTPEQVRMEILREEHVARNERRRLEKIEENKRRQSPYHVWRRTWGDGSGRPVLIDATKGYMPQSQPPKVTYELILTTFDWDEAEDRIRSERKKLETSRG